MSMVVGVIDCKGFDGRKRQRIRFITETHYFRYRSTIFIEGESNQMTNNNEM